MILAAGRGIRLKPLTDHVPKPLVRIGNETLIEHHIKKLAAAEFESIVINTAHMGNKIQEYIGDGSHFGIPIYYSDEGEQALETGGGIANALPILGNETFIVVNADIYCDIPFDPKLSVANGHMHLIMVNNPAHHPQGDFDSSELNLPGNQRYTFSGVGYYHPSLFIHERRIFPLIETIQSAIAHKKISAEIFTGAWFDVGTGGRLHEVYKYALSQRSHLP